MPTPAPIGQAPIDVAVNNQMLSDNFSQLGNLAVGAAGAGLTVRLLQSLLSGATPRKSILPDPNVTVPTLKKRADGPAWSQGLHGAGSYLGMYRDPSNPGPSNFWKGHDATDPAGVPWTIPAAALAVGIPAIGAYQLANYAINKRHKQDLKDQVDESQQDFEHSILEAQRPSLKAASALDRLAEKITETMTKKAVGEETIKDFAGAGAGLYGASLLTALLGGGVLGYNRARKSDPYRIAQERTKQRLAERYATAPPQVFVSPELTALPKG